MLNTGGYSASRISFINKSSRVLKQELFSIFFTDRIIKPPGLSLLN